MKTSDNATLIPIALWAVKATSDGKKMTCFSCLRAMLSYGAICDDGKVLYLCCSSMVVFTLKIKLSVILTKNGFIQE